MCSSRRALVPVMAIGVCVLYLSEIGASGQEAPHKDDTNAFKAFVSQAAFSAIGKEVSRVGTELGLESQRDRQLLMVVLNATPKKVVTSLEVTLLSCEQRRGAARKQSELDGNEIHLTIGLTKREIAELPSDLVVAAYASSEDGKVVLIQKTFEVKDGRWREIGDTALKKSR
jgi:hypothetical protein